jgi:hypothetical protein
VDAPIPDPYGRCERRCNHDLARGVLVSELLESDGPYPPSQLLVNLSSQRAALLDDEQNEIEGQQVLSTRSAV